MHQYQNLHWLSTAIVVIGNALRRRHHQTVLAYELVVP
jgi:hypothetical protein